MLPFEILQAIADYSDIQTRETIYTTSSAIRKQAPHRVIFHLRFRPRRRWSPPIVETTMILHISGFLGPIILRNNCRLGQYRDLIDYCLDNTLHYTSRPILYWTPAGDGALEKSDNCVYTFDRDLMEKLTDALREKHLFASCDRWSPTIIYKKLPASNWINKSPTKKLNVSRQMFRRLFLLLSFIRLAKSIQFAAASFRPTVICRRIVRTVFTTAVFNNRPISLNGIAARNMARNLCMRSAKRNTNARSL